MWIKCSECNVLFQLSRLGIDDKKFVTYCPNCKTYLNVEIKVNVVKSESQHKR